MNQKWCLKRLTLVEELLKIFEPNHNFEIIFLLLLFHVKVVINRYKSSLFYEQTFVLQLTNAIYLIYICANMYWYCHCIIHIKAAPLNYHYISSKTPLINLCFSVMEISGSLLINTGCFYAHIYIHI